VKAKSDPWVTCRMAAANVTPEWLAEVKTNGAFVRQDSNGDVLVRYRASELRKAPN
jgi:hypothetical protein